MMLLRLIAVTALVSSSPAFSDETVRTDDGRVIVLREDGTYAVTADESGHLEEKFAPIELTDLKLDIEKMDGQLVQVDVRLTAMGDMLMLMDQNEMFDSNPVMAVQDDLAREKRKYIIEHCSPSCDVTIRGKVEDVLFQKGIRLIDVTPDGQ